MKNNWISDSTLIVGGAIAAAACCYLLFGTSSGLSANSSSISLKFYAAVSGGLAITLFSLLRMRPSARRVVASVLVIGVLMAYCFELLLALGVVRSASTPLWSVDGLSEQRKQVLNRELGITIDPRNRDQLLDDMRRGGTEAAPAIMLFDLLKGAGTARSAETMDVDKLMSIGGISNAVTVLCNEAGFVRYASDEHGFRNPPGIWSSQRVDIAAVGESFVQGYCVPDGKSFVDRLRTNERVVLNLGVSGESALLQLAALKEYASAYAPTQVLWFFCEGIDLPDLYDESTSPLLMHYLEPTFSQRLIDRQSEIDGVLHRVVSDMAARHRLGLDAPPRASFGDLLPAILRLWYIRHRLQSAVGIEDEDPHAWSILRAQPDNLLNKTLAEAQRLVASWKGRLYFVYLPSWSRFRNHATLPDRERSAVLKLVSDLGIPVIDAEPAFREQGDPLSLFPFRRFGHYNETGNQVVADAILRSLSLSDQRNAVRK
jgi:hypothetical protein